VTLLGLTEWLELEVFVVLACASLAKWHRRREPAAGWLALTFALLGGILLADRFLPVSAKAVDGWVWFDRVLIVDLALVPYCLAVRQLLATDLCSVVEEALADSGLEPHRLCLEITESALLEDTYLKRFPVDVLKIDRSFVAGLCLDPQDRAIVASVIDLAHAFGLTTTAEGVETDEQLAQLRALGCEQGQGYLWSPPLAADDAGGWLADRHVGARF
jgi:predicted signal transduction protein with EAL and GGDEF domain